MVRLLPRFLFRLGTRALLARRAARRAPAVAYDAWGLRLSVGGQVRQALPWDAIAIVAIRIEDAVLPCPYWYVGNEETLLRIPNDAEGGPALFQDGFREHLAGYDTAAARAVIATAMASLDGGFIVWRSAAAI